MNLLRYWFPQLGGGRQCISCGFLSLQEPLLTDIDTDGWEYRDEEIPIIDRIGLTAGAEIEEGNEQKRPRCYRGLWVLRSLHEEDLQEDLTHRHSCRLFFPHKSGATPQAHLELAHRASNRWWTFWAVRSATGTAGVVSALLAAYLPR